MLWSMEAFDFRFQRARRGIFFAREREVRSEREPFRINNVIGGADPMRVKITLVCTECKQRNYDTMKNKKNDPDRLEMKKYCRFCRKHTLHKESK